MKSSTSSNNDSINVKNPRKCIRSECKSNSKSRGLCKKHGGGLRCDVPGCTTSARPGGKCIKHGGGLCKEKGCLTGARSGGLCLMHQRIKQIREKRGIKTEPLQQFETKKVHRRKRKKQYSINFNNDNTFLSQLQGEPILLMDLKENTSLEPLDGYSFPSALSVEFPDIQPMAFHPTQLFHSDVNSCKVKNIPCKNIPPAYPIQNNPSFPMYLFDPPTSMSRTINSFNAQMLRNEITSYSSSLSNLPHSYQDARRWSTKEKTGRTRSFTIPEPIPYHLK